MIPIKLVDKHISYTDIMYKLPNGSWHREDGPAFLRIYNGGNRHQSWCYNGKLHRYGGPAVTYPNKTGEYWVHGEIVTAPVKDWLKEQNYDWFTMSEQEKWELDLFMRSL